MKSKKKTKKGETASTTAHAANVDEDKGAPSQRAGLLNAMIRSGQDAQRRFQQFMAAVTQFGRSLVEGKAGTKDIIESLERIQPVLRQVPAGKFPELFDAENVAEVIKSLKFLNWLETAPPDSRPTQARAIAEQFRRKTGCTIQDFTKSLNAFMQKRRELAGGPRANAVLLKAHDDFHVGQLRIEGKREQALHALADRLKLAAIRGEKDFIKRVCKELKKEPSLPEHFQVKNFNLGIIKEFLLENWSGIEKWAPVFGLHEFSRDALRDYFKARLDPHEKFEWLTSDAIEQERKRSKLKRSLPSRVKEVFPWQDSHGRPNKNFITLRIKGGQKVETRRSTIRSHP